VRIYLLLCLAAVSMSCKDDARFPRTDKISGRYLYLKDANGRCVALDTVIDTYGTTYAQSGKINIYFVSGQCGE